MAKYATFSPEDAKKVAEATSRVLGFHSTDADRTQAFNFAQGVFRVRIDSEPDEDGIYDGTIMRLDPETLAWIEYGECYVYKVDTI